jgi:hypothetical protein
MSATDQLPDASHMQGGTSQSQSHIATDTVSQSVCLGFKPKSWTFDQIFFPLKVTVLSFWGALSDERSGLSCVSLCH